MPLVEHDLSALDRPHHPLVKVKQSRFHPWFVAARLKPQPCQPYQPSQVDMCVSDWSILGSQYYGLCKNPVLGKGATGRRALP